MKQIFSLLVILTTTFLLTSCEHIEDPAIKGIEDVEILTANQKKIELNANMIFHNPNPFALDLDKADMVTIVDGIELAIIKQTYESSMPAKEEFKMPFHIDMDVAKLYEDDPLAAITKGLELISNRKIKVQFKGTIDVGKGRAKISVPIDRMELVEF